jgi:dolichol-phosphate mannosyltransferase
VSLCSDDPRVKGIRLSRNFGHQYALLAGLAHARGRAVVTMDADLQHPPGVIVQLVREWQAGAKIVHAVRVDDDATPRLKRLTSSMFYRLYSAMSGVQLEEGMADFRLLDREVVNALLRFPEQGIFLRGLVQWVGFPSAKVSFKVGQRFRGRSKYTLRKMLSLAWTGIADFSVIPLHLGFLLGFVTSGLALLALAYAVFVKLFTDAAVPGWASEVAIIAFLFGILFALVGVIGEYIARILVEVKHRPRYLIMERVGFAALHAPLWEDVAPVPTEPAQVLDR